MLEAALRDQVRQATGMATDQHRVVHLKGEASNRAYYRIGDGPNTHVVMVMPKDALTQSEEAIKGDPPKELPFVNIHRYLQKLGVRVPRILRFDQREMLLVLEDLGDVTFEDAFRRGENAEALYGRAVDLLAQLRVAAEAQPDPDCLAFTRVFDEDLYDWEFHHFREYGLEMWSGKKPSPAERAELDGIFRSVSAQLSRAPKGFTHRDYQSRNLMVKGDDLVVIDFQDALQGPRQYDLVSLLRDSYIELEPSFVNAMVDRYIVSFAAAGGERLDPVAFKAFFNLLTVQRKLKDAGRFEYIHRVKKNPGFLPSIPASLRYVKNALSQQPELSRLHDIVAQYVPELR